MRGYRTADEILDEVAGKGDSFQGRDVEGWWQKFTNDPSNAAPAFEAISSIVLPLMEGSDPGRAPDINIARKYPDENVTLPLWCVSQIVIGWNRYMEKRDSQTMEQAFGLHPMRPGSRSRLQTDSTGMEDMRIALEVAYMVGREPQRGDITKAQGIVAEMREISTEKVEKAWKANKNNILSRLYPPPPAQG